VKNNFSLQVKTDLNTLPFVLKWFNENYPVIIPGNIWIQCQTILAEGLTNAIRHAHCNQDVETPILIEVEVQERSLKMCIWDQGDAFDLDLKLASISQIVDQEQIGGRGLWLIQLLADEVSYIRFPDDCNCLLIIKNFEPVV
jgi:serine/threonine-protein kinase RsbW